MSRSGRSPSQVLGGFGDEGNTRVIREMKRIASRYTSKDESQDLVLQDFLSFRQALNVASADQRLLVFVNADKSATEKISPTLKKLFADEKIVGRFHLDFAGDEDDQWSKSIKDAEKKPAINIIRAGEYGLDGAVVSQLALESSAKELKKTLLDENKKFGASEDRKLYAQHVLAGRRKGIKYESEIPYGEDRDGDGEIDRTGRKRGGSNREGGGRRRGRGR